MDQSRLFRLAVDALVVRAAWVPYEGWELVVLIRRGDEEWDEAQKDSYRCLTTQELVDVTAASLSSALGL